VCAETRFSTHTRSHGPFFLGIRRTSQSDYASNRANWQCLIGAATLMLKPQSSSCTKFAGEPDPLRKEVCQWLDQIRHPAFRAATRHHASFVRIAGQTSRLINQDVLLSNGKQGVLATPELLRPGHKEESNASLKISRSFLQLFPSSSRPLKQGQSAHLR
jgi:hypothetical protein